MNSEHQALTDVPLWLLVQAEAARALGRNEPRLKLERVTALSLLDGKINMSVAGEYLGDSFVLEVSV